MIRVADSLTVDASGLVLTKDGYLVGDAKIARAGNVQEYYGRELGLTGDDAGKVFGVYRDPDIVFNKDSMRSLAGRPITRNHPSEEVNARNWKDLAKGSVGGTISRDGEHVVASMAIMDAAAVDELVANPGARALSAGYTVDIAKEDGTSPDGTPYQYKQTGELRFNHVAYLPDNNPRAGNTRIGDKGNPDSNQPAQTTKDEGGHMADNLRKVLVDGLQVETTEAGEVAINALKAKVADSADRLTAANDAHAASIAAKDSEIAAKDAEIQKLKESSLTDAALDAKVAARSDLIASAKKVADLDYTGKSEAEIRKLAVAKKFGDAAIADKSDAYVEARFDIAVADSAKDPVREAFKDNGRTPTNLNDAKALEDAAHARYLARHDRKKKEA